MLPDFLRTCGMSPLPPPSCFVGVVTRNQRCFRPFIIDSPRVFLECPPSRESAVSGAFSKFEEVFSRSSIYKESLSSRTFPSFFFSSPKGSFTKFRSRSSPFVSFPFCQRTFFFSLPRKCQHFRNLDKSAPQVKFFPVPEDPRTPLFPAHPAPPLIFFPPPPPPLNTFFYRVGDPSAGTSPLFRSLFEIFSPTPRRRLFISFVLKPSLKRFRRSFA